MKHSNLLHKPKKARYGLYQHITPENAGWQTLHFAARRMKKGETWRANTESYEYAIVLLSGNFSVRSGKGEWKIVNGRKCVFSGIAHTLYLPHHTDFVLRAESDELDIAYGWCKSDDGDYPARLKTPEEAANSIEIRGGDDATRQINNLIEPGFNCCRIVACEVYTAPGSWSSFPAHKHDERKLGPNGEVLEAKLEEIYFYKIAPIAPDKPDGWAIQQVYTHDGSLDEIMRVGHDDVVLVPKGYHPVVMEPLYKGYYLNFLAGSDQSLANTADVHQEWMFEEWRLNPERKDPRMPMVSAEMNNKS